MTTMFGAYAILGVGLTVGAVGLLAVALVIRDDIRKAKARKPSVLRRNPWER